MNSEDRKYAVNLRRSAPKQTEAYQAFSAAALHDADGEIPAKYRELIAIGVALTTQCEMCLASHVVAAKKLGATEQEVSETTYITSALRAGAAYTHGMKALRLYGEDASD